MLRVWGFEFSTNYHRIQLALHVKGVDFEPVLIDPAERSAVEMLTGQPLVPVLQTDDELLWDSPRILEWIDARHPDPPLYPADAARRAEVQVFLDWFNRVWKVAPNQLADAGPDEAWEAELRGHQAVFENLLCDGREFLMGEFGIADVTAWPFLRYAVDQNPRDTEVFHQVLRDHLELARTPRLRAWIDRVAARSPL